MNIYRNYPRINEIEDIELRESLLTTDLKSRKGLKLVEEHAEFFIDTPVAGPIPLSIILRLDIAYCEKDDHAVAGHSPHSHGVIPIEIPIVGFNYPHDYDDNLALNDLTFDEFLPDGFDVRSLIIGSDIEVNGAKLIVIENNKTYCELICIPVEAIIVDCFAHEYC